MLTERLARSGYYSLVGSGFAAVAALLLAVLVGNVLGAHGTGVFFQAVGFFTIASQVLRLGTNSSIVRSISEQHAFGRTGESWRTVIIAIVPVALASVIIAVAIAWAAVPLAHWLSGSSEERELAQLIYNMAPFIVPSALLAVLLTAVRMLRGIVAFTVLQNILVPLSRLTLVAAALMLAASTVVVVQAWMLVLPFWLLVTILVLARPMLIDWRQRTHAVTGTREASRQFWRFSGARAVGGALETTLEWSDVLIVAALMSPASAGIYAIATRAIRAGQVIDQAMRLAVSPTISRLLARSELGAARTLHTAVARALILSSWPFYLTLASMGPAILGIFGEEFVDGAVVLAILAGAMMVATSAGMLQSVLLQGGKASWQVYNKAAALTISIGLNLLLIPAFGLVGAALTWTACVLIDTAIAGWQVHHGLRLRLEPRKLLLAMCIPLTVFGVGGLAVRLAFGSTLTVLFVSLGVFCTAYLLILWRMREHLGIVALWREVPLLGKRATTSARSAAPKNKIADQTAQPAHPITRSKSGR